MAYSKRYLLKALSRQESWEYLFLRYLEAGSHGTMLATSLLVRQELEIGLSRKPDHNEEPLTDYILLGIPSMQRSQVI